MKEKYTVFHESQSELAAGAIDAASYFIPECLYSSMVLVPGHKYPKTGIKEIYGKTSVRVCAPIGMIPLHFRVLMAWDKYCTTSTSSTVPL